MKNNDTAGLVALGGIVALVAVLVLKGAYEAAAVVLVTGLFAFLIESMTEYLFGILVDCFPKLDPGRKALPFIPLFLGVMVMFYYNIDLVAVMVNLLPEQHMENNPIGIVFTGMMVGRGANFIHQLMSTYFPKKETAGG